MHSPRSILRASRFFVRAKKSTLGVHAIRLCVMTLALVWNCDLTFAQQGHVLSGVGPINRSMGGASVAAPIDPTGSLNANPAVISGLGRLNVLDDEGRSYSEMAFGLELLYPRPNLSSAIPALGLAGSTDSDSGVFGLPSFSIVHRPENSYITYGLGLYAIGGFGANYASSATNPILLPQPAGAGRILSEYQIMQIAPTASIQITEELAVGFSPTINLARLLLNPNLFLPTNLPSGFFPDSTHSEMHWGIGFQTGLYYTPNEDWGFGVTFKSPQWFETLEFNSEDDAGLPRHDRLDLDYPMIVSLGAGYTGIDGLTIAVDVRYIDYENTDGFDDARFVPSGATFKVNGAGWDSIFTVAVGAQYELSDCTTVRMGYVYNENPVDASITFFNAAAPVIIQHQLSGGFTREINDVWSVSLAYVHMFKNDIEGPFIAPVVGAVPGTSVRSEVVADSLIIGTSVRF